MFSSQSIGSQSTHILYEIWTILMGIMWHVSQSQFHLLFKFIEMKFYSLSLLCDVCNEVHEHMQ